MKSPPRVINFVTRLNIGGPAIYTILLTQGLREHGFDARLLVGNIEESEGDMMDLAYQKGIEPLVIPSLKREIRPLQDLKSLYQTWRILRKFSPHILHTHTSKAGLVGRVAGLFSSIPRVVHTYHGHVFSQYFHPLKSAFFLNLERMLAHLSTRLITLSPRLQHDLSRKYHIASANKILSLALGLDLEPFRKIQDWEQIRHKFGIPSNAFVLGTVGRMVDVKNHSLLIEAFARLNKDRKNLRLMIVGDGALRKDLEAQARQLNIAEKLVITGFQRDLAPYYQAFDLLVLPSKNEGTPLVILEGFASSLPVVATNVGGVGDLFSQPRKDFHGLEEAPEGILVPSQDEKRLCQAISLLIENQTKRLQMGKRARERSFLYDSSHFIQRMIGFYEELLCFPRNFSAIQIQPNTEKKEL